jgi:hypothetical protein
MVGTTTNLEWSGVEFHHIVAATWNISVGDAILQKNRMHPGFVREGIMAAIFVGSREKDWKEVLLTAM